MLTSATVWRSGVPVLLRFAELVELVNAVVFPGCCRRTVAQVARSAGKVVPV